MHWAHQSVPLSFFFPLKDTMAPVSFVVFHAAVLGSDAAPPSYASWLEVPALSDEFDGAHLDRSKWLDYQPYWKGKEPSQFLPANVQLENGQLLLRSTLANASQEGNWVWSACLSSTEPISGPGYYEARMRASNMAMTASFWFQSQFSWEIDVTEAMGAPSDPKMAYYASLMHMNTHNFSAGWDNDIEHPSAYTMSTSSAETFHVYGVEWNSSAISYYLDGAFIYQVSPEGGFDEDMYLFFDTEAWPWMGWPLVEDLQDSEKNAMRVDWVRAWEAKVFEFEARETHWSDAVIMSHDGEFHRKSGDAGKWSFDSDGSLVLDWNRWGTNRLQSADGGRSFSSAGLKLSTSLPPAWFRSRVPGSSVITPAVVLAV